MTFVGFSNHFLVPTAPLSFEVSSSTTTSLTLAWLDPISNGGAAVTNFQLEKFSNSAYSIIYTGTAKTFTSTGLSAGTAYQFRVAAINSQGIGAYATGTFSTDASTPATGNSLPFNETLYVQFPPLPPI